MLQVSITDNWTTYRYIGSYYIGMELLIDESLNKKLYQKFSHFLQLIPTHWTQFQQIVLYHQEKILSKTFLVHGMGCIKCFLTSSSHTTATKVKFVR